MKKYVFVPLSIVVLAACALLRPSATATLDSMGTSTAKGTVTFTQLSDDSVQVTVDATGVPPGVHGFHVHEGNQCGSDGMAAGGHFNPTNVAHGAPNQDPHHAGDFGNVTADGNGVVRAQFNMRGITVEPGPNSVVGRAVILHEKPDDLTTQPTGNAGGRIACGVTQAK
jgi:Cu-Zn family superoxide dismutase